MPSDSGMSAEQRREGLCDVCGADYPTPWFAPNDLWNRAGGGGFLCLHCFIRFAEQAGIKPTGWMLSEENVELSTTLERLRAAEGERDRAKFIADAYIKQYGAMSQLEIEDVTKAGLSLELVEGLEEMCRNCEAKIVKLEAMLKRRNRER